MTADDKLEVLNQLREAWSEACDALLADKGKTGVYRGPAMVLVDLGDHLIHQLEQYGDFESDEFDEEDLDQTTPLTEEDPFE